jgi:divalent metal cation (Fe/Co/Zn/Cd) transporter
MRAVVAWLATSEVMVLLQDRHRPIPRLAHWRVMPAAGGTPQLDQARRARLNRAALLLASASLAYNVFEAAVALTAGVLADSTALISFGGDSVVESLSALVIIWQFWREVPEDAERRALRGVAVAFVVLAVYVAVQAVLALVTGARPEASPVGVALALTSLVVMPVLVWGKRRVADALGSPTVRADSMQSLLCTYLSVVLLVGLLLSGWLGWWWADPVAGLVIAAVAANEGREAWRGDDC